MCGKRSKTLNRSEKSQGTKTLAESKNTIPIPYYNKEFLGGNCALKFFPPYIFSEIEKVSLHLPTGLFIFT